MIWNYIFYAVLALYIYKSIPKPQNAKPAGLGDFNVTTADPSRSIPVIFGTVDLRGSNLTWYGDFSSVAIRKKSGK